MLQPYSRVYAAINLDAATSNMKNMKEALPSETGIIGVVKADGYGHGSVPIAKAIDPYVEGYAVATIDEALLLRRHSIRKQILILGITPESRFEELLAYDLSPAMFRFDKVKSLSDMAVRVGKTARVHIAVDTGMNRIGLKPDPENARLTAAMASLPGIRIEGIFTHFSRADERDKSVYEAQYEAYQSFVNMLELYGVSIGQRHCSNSAGIVDALSSNDLDMVRAGISIYGMYPSDEVDHRRVSLTPVMELKSFISYIKEIAPGEAVSYGGTFVAERFMKVATIPVGYGDGYSRGLSGRGSVLIHGKRAPILGRICMDQFMADVTEIPEAAEDDIVTLMGKDGDEQITAEELARLSGGYHYELICDIGKRVPRVYFKDGQIVGVKDYFNDIYEGFGYV